MNQLVTRNWRDLIRPRNVPVEEETLTEHYGKFVAEPLERGFGTTLGNSLRRVLLSSLQGARMPVRRAAGAEMAASSFRSVEKPTAGRLRPNTAPTSS